ncbi:pyridoxine 5'-phosphate oxidase C-terminal domain-containing protein [Streptomyces sp. NPDC020472]|uniref:pyridoxine 5'-phosphate oxidase C-terminal domain-containing protein n=1 Tax=Streptomyces sp. NPDC020472 TaxID=3365075 RepID=UPI00378A2BD1
MTEKDASTVRDRALRDSPARIEAEPDLVDPACTLHAVVPDVVEFWRAATTRVHVRPRYEGEGADRQRRQLRP